MDLCTDSRNITRFSKNIRRERVSLRRPYASEEYIIIIIMSNRRALCVCDSRRVRADFSYFLLYIIRSTETDDRFSKLATAVTPVERPSRDLCAFKSRDENDGRTRGWSPWDLPCA